MTKKILAVVLAAALFLTCGVLVFAEDAAQTNEVKLFANLSEQVDKEEAIGSVTIENDSITVPECTATKEFFVFDSWNTHVDGSGVSYQPEDVIEGDALYEEEGVLITLYAQWVSENADFVVYSIYYDANGGEGVTEDTETYMAGFTAMTALNEFTYGDYEFYHWNTKPDNTGDIYDEFSEIIFPEEGASDITLYAIWYDPATDSLVFPGSDAGNDTEGPVTDTDTEAPVVTDTDAEDTDDAETEDEVVYETVETLIPETGDASSVAIALAVSAVAMGALVVLKKKD